MQTMMEEITLARLPEFLAQGAQLLDVRNAAELGQGMLPHARHIPMNLIPIHAQELLSNPQPLVVYCQMGGRSAQVCHWLAQQGHPRVYNLAGGFAAWIATQHRGNR